MYGNDKEKLIMDIAIILLIAVVLLFKGLLGTRVVLDTDFPDVDPPWDIAHSRWNHGNVN